MDTGNSTTNEKISYGFSSDEGAAVRQDSNMSAGAGSNCSGGETNSIKIPEKLLLLAGCGDYPRLAAEGAREAGVRYIAVVGFKGSVDKRLIRMADKTELFRFGQTEKIYRAISDSDCEAAIMAGQISPLSLFSSCFDSEALKLLRGVKVHNAHSIFGQAIEKIREELGVEFLPASFFMRRHIPRPGVLTRLRPDERIFEDIGFGNRIGMEICGLDIGQTVVVKDGTVVAVEGIEGTDSTIKRSRRICGKGAVVVKVAKNGHDMRFDIPVIGLRTIRVMRTAGIAALSVQARRTIMLNMEDVIAAADRAGIAVVAVDSGLAPAPEADFPARTQRTVL